MPPVVQAVCPGCRNVLRIPAEWVEQTLKCKHCGLVVQGRPKPTAPAAKPSRSAAAASPFAGLGTPTAATSGGSPFNFDDTTASPRRRRRGGGLKGALVLGLFVALAAAVGIAFRPQLSSLLKGNPQAQVADNKGDLAAESAAETNNEAAAKPKIDLPTKPKAEPAPKEAEPKKQPDNPEQPPRILAPAKNPAKENPSLRRTPGSDLPVASGPFPRRALLINVTSYLYANPIAPGDKGRDVHALAKVLTTGLRVPDKQVFELNDAARDAARAPLKPVIEQTVAEFLATNREQDRVLVLFVGHAVELGDEVFLVPVEGEVDNKETLIPLAWLYQQLEKSKARQKVLVLDVCRFNPTRGMERPGSGVMGEKLDALLQKPPVGVQVWSSCVKDQFSYEFEDGVINGGLFIDTLAATLGPNAAGGTIAKPEDPLPLATLVDKVNAGMKQELNRRLQKQTSRLAGKEPEGGAAYDAKEPVAPRVEIRKPPEPEGGAAKFDQVTGILRDVQVPPVKRGQANQSDARWDVLPPFSGKALEAYKNDEANSPLREVVKKARDLLVAKAAQAENLQIDFRAPVNEKAGKDEIKKRQRAFSRYQYEVQEVHDLLEAAGKDRDKEKSKRWLAHYDYLFARVKAQLAFMYEYNSMLGQWQRDQLPPRDPNLHNGWRMASQEKLQGDSAGKKLAQDSRKLLDKLVKDHAGTPWEVLAKRDRLTALGLEWQPARIGE